MYCIRVDYPNDWKYVNLYTLADLHVGDCHTIYSEVERRINEIAPEPLWPLHFERRFDEHGTQEQRPRYL